MRKMDPIIKPLEGDILPEDSLLLNAIVGKAKDVRDVKIRDIQDRVYLRWTTQDEISIKKIGKLFFFFCLDVRDRNNLDALGSTSYDGALFLFTKCRPRASFQSFNFTQSSIWVRVEGPPLIYNKPQVARRILERIRKVLYFDNTSTSQDSKTSLGLR